ncbi:unnamed protein product [Mytilus edulis]|uniref:Uncharacterized protein n=1 Tax=Mytilus edulis TaxID=6550 RepID=A0A8S3TG51_MYTED|nr:unnamed protein product [Mytilus edulis]
MVAKLTAFYDLALLPEIASPRHKKYPGIREPGNWKDRTKRKCSQLKFLGRRISHEWIKEDNNSKWYSGTVTGVLTETDGADGAEYEVLYDGDDEPHIIDHLLEDYRNEKEIVPSCDDCGVVFESVSYLACLVRHKNKWCPENNHLKRSREIEDEDILSKKPSVNEIDIGGEDMAFIKLAELAREANTDIWEEKVDK